MQRKILIVFLIFLFGNITYSQSLFLKGFGSHINVNVNYNNTFNICKQYDSNIILSTIFTDSIDLDYASANTVVASYAQSVATSIIVACNPQGHTLWYRIFGGATAVRIQDVVCDSYGSIYVAGLFQGTIDFDPGLGVFNLSNPSTNGSKGFLLKLTASGNFVWARYMNTMSVKKIQTWHNRLILFGTATDTVVDADPGNGVFVLNNVSNASPFICILDTAANFIDAINIKGEFWMNGQYTEFCKLYKNGDIAVSGEFFNTVFPDFYNSTDSMQTTIANMPEFYVMMYDSSLKLKWKSRLGAINPTLPNNNFAQCEGIEFDQSGNLFVIGTTPNASVHVVDKNGTTNINPINGFNFILKYSYSGQLSWTKSFGNTKSYQSCRLRDLVINSSGDLFITGTYDSTADFDPGLAVVPRSPASSYSNIFVQRLDSTANFMDFYSLNHQSSVATEPRLLLTGNDYFLNIYDIYTAKLYSDYPTNVDSLQPIHTRNHYLNQIFYCHNQDSLVVANTCSTYELNNVIYNNSGSYVQTFTDILGCDSTITLHLTAVHIDTLITQNDITLTANQSNASYQWYDCDKQLPLVGQTSQSFNASYNGNFACIISVGNCTDTTICKMVNTVGLAQVPKDGGFKLFPNPSRGWVSFSAPQTNHDYRIFVYDVNGKLVSERFARPNVGTFLHLVNKGLYFIKVMGDDSVFYEKLLIE